MYISDKRLDYLLYIKQGEEMNELEELGKFIIKEIYNDVVATLEKDLFNIFEGLGQETTNKTFNSKLAITKENLLDINKEAIKTVIFEILKIFDENSQYKLMYDKDNLLSDLQEVAENNDYGNGYLSGELFNWLEAYSEFD